MNHLASIFVLNHVGCEFKSSSGKQWRHRAIRPLLAVHRELENKILYLQVLLSSGDD